MFSVIQKCVGRGAGSYRHWRENPLDATGVINEQAAVLARDAGLNVVRIAARLLRSLAWAWPNKKSPKAKTFRGFVQGSVTQTRGLDCLRMVCASSSMDGCSGCSSSIRYLAGLQPGRYEPVGRYRLHHHVIPRSGAKLVIHRQLIGDGSESE